MTQIIRINNPIYVDACVNKIQTLFDSLDWIELIYPKCEIAEKSNIPQYRISDERYENINPNNDLKSFIFFVLESDKRNQWKSRIFEFSLICWYNTLKFSNNYYIGESLIRDVLMLLEKNKADFEVGDIIHNENKEAVWKGLNYNSFLPNDTPFGSFRVVFKAFWDELCY
jgi:hypothetical protein